MKISEIFEGKTHKQDNDSIVVPQLKPRNPFGKNPKISGAGKHKSDKFSRHEKHKNKQMGVDESNT